MNTDTSKNWSLVNKRNFCTKDNPVRHNKSILTMMLIMMNLHRRSINVRFKSLKGIIEVRNSIGISCGRNSNGGGQSSSFLEEVATGVGSLCMVAGGCRCSWVGDGRSKRCKENECNKWNSRAFISREKPEADPTRMAERASDSLTMVLLIISVPLGFGLLVRFERARFGCDVHCWWQRYVGCVQKSWIQWKSYVEY